MCIDPFSLEGLALVYFMPSGSYTVSASSLSEFPELKEEGFVGDIPFRPECSKVYYALQIVWSQAFVFVLC